LVVKVMGVISGIKDIAIEAAEWRRAMHASPQTAYEEKFASDLVASKLEEWGVSFEKGWAKGTGIVATIEGKENSSGEAIALRADMDALDIDEETNLPYSSKIDHKMHACGHDGHTATLLAATKYLSKNNDFNGKVHLIFQPAEEGENGADKMIEEGLFEKFPVKAVHAVHNWPWLPLGKIGMRVGAIMASVDEFHITVHGKGSHAAVPQGSIDTTLVAAHIVVALQSIVSRNVSPVDSAVVSVTNFNSGTGAFNIIPERSELVGTVRTFSNEVRPLVEKRMKEIVTKTAEAFGATAEIDYKNTSAATINTKAEVELAAMAAADVIGKDNVDTDTEPYMTGEDFGSMLMKAPGTYVYLGQGNPDDKECHNSQPLHSAHYDFNDGAIEVGASYFVRLVERSLPV
jgi:amidohydrolase